MSNKIFDNDLILIRKNKVTLTLSKPEYTGICILELSKVLMYDVYVDFSNDKKFFGFSNYSSKSKYYDNSNKLVVGKMKDETASVAIGEFVRLKTKMHSYLVDGNSKHKKAKSANKIIATISQNEYKDVLLNKKCLRHLMNRTKSVDHRISTHKINKISWSCFDYQIYIQKNGCDGLALGCET